MDIDAIEILVVEDNPHDAELTMRALRKNNLSNSVLIINDGEEALDFLFCRGKYQKRSFMRPPNVVLLDITLPKVNGLEVLRIVKGDKRTSQIPIVVVTSSRQESDINEAYNLGVNSYVIKPVDLTQFICAISSLGLYWLLVNEPRKPNKIIDVN